MNAAAPSNSYSQFHTSHNPFQPSIQAAEHLRARLMNAAPTPNQEFRRESAAPAQVAFGLADVRQIAPQVAILDAPVWSSSRQRFWVRPEVAIRLERAARELPSTWMLGFWEGFRPIEVQRNLWEAGFSLLQESHPYLNQTQLEKVLETYVARPTTNAPHSSGSAVDVAVINRDGKILDATTAEGRLGLAAMSSALTSAGLSNYEPEWWHWSHDEDGQYSE